MDFSFLIILLFVIALPLFIFHIWALVDVLRTPQGTWMAAGQNQILWGVVVLFLSFIGPILYLVIARPQLLAVQSRES